jgi:uncharacterized protein (TIGR00369 family)
MPGLDELAARHASGEYARALGARVAGVWDDGARLVLPFAEGNSNPGGALHGGVAASLVLMGGALAGDAGGEASAVERSTVDVSIAYLAAAINEGVVAEARTLRRGKELVFVEVDVRTEAGKAIARGLVARRLAPPSPAERVRAARADLPAGSDASPPGFTRVFTSAPFMARLGLQVVRVERGDAVVRLPWLAANADHDGALHEGALAALADTTGAMASWSLVPLDPRNKASTPVVHANFHAPVRDEAVLAVAHTTARRDEIFTNAVTVLAETSGTVVATAVVTYRIVVPRAG